jgi:predicted MPP superfamily phosphohydrolase
MVVIGNESPWFRPAPDLSRCPVGPFRFCLSHTPDNYFWARQNRVDLMLCGHVHGGQVRLPFVGSLFVPSRFSRRYDRGAFAAGPTFMYVGRGLAGREPLRFNCKPEVTRVILATGKHR